MNYKADRAEIDPIVGFAEAFGYLWVPEKDQEGLTKAFYEALKTEAGQRLLRAINVSQGSHYVARS